MDPLATIVAFAAAVAAVVYLARLGVKAYRCLSKLERFLDDWYGDEQVPGVLVRVKRIEAHVGLPVRDAPSSR